MNDLLTQVPDGFLPRVYYGLTRGNQTYRFIQDTVLNLELTGNVGDAFEFLLVSPMQTYVEAIGVKINETQAKIIIPGDYYADATSFSVVNTRTGSIDNVTFDNSELTLQDASYLGQYDADENINKQITVLHDIETNESNVIFASVDYSGDKDYNWVRIGGFMNGVNGKAVYSVTSSNISTILGFATIGDSLLAGEAFTHDGISFNIGDLKTITTLSPLAVSASGNIRGPQGNTGAAGANGQNGQDGATPTIVDDYWYINGTSTGVKAVGTDGTDGQNGQSFQMKSGLYSTPANYGQSGNVGPDSQVLQQLPTLPQSSGLTGFAYVVYDPLTTPLSPYYDLYYANNGDVSWTIMHPFSGLKGEDGADGYTPYIQNNQWYINGVSTGVQATGDTGATGPQGWGFYAATSSVSNISEISGCRVGDLIVGAQNDVTGLITVLGVSLAKGQVVKVTSATTGTYYGSISGIRGFSIIPTTTNVTSVTDWNTNNILNTVRVGDHFLNTSSSTLTILGQSVAAGGLCSIISDTTGSTIGLGSILGPTGATPNISATATGLASGASPTVTVSGTTDNPILTFGIPAGAQGPAGAGAEPERKYDMLLPISNIVNDNGTLSSENIFGSNVWTDGSNIYYSAGTTQLKLNRETHQWEIMTWNGLTNFYGAYVWTDKTNIYYSSGSSQYVLDIATSTWSAKTWTGVSSLYGSNVWTDGSNIYYSSSTLQYVLNVATSTWSVKTWTGLTNFNGNNIWTDGSNIYHSGTSAGTAGSTYQLDKSTSTWTSKSWTNSASVNGACIWNDGVYIHYDQLFSHKYLNKATESWDDYNWINWPTNQSEFDGHNIWSDGSNTYIGNYNANTQYVFAKFKPKMQTSTMSQWLLY